MKIHAYRTAKVGLVVSAITMLAFSGMAGAATSKTTTPTNASTNTLKISPLRTDISVEKGKSQKVTISVSNITGSAIAVHPIENDFVAGDENGTPAIILDENSYAPTHSLKRFMAPLQDVIIPANQTKDIILTINVPATAQPGGYYGAVRFAPTNGTGSNNLNIGASVASLVLLTVPGPTTEKLVLTNYDVKQSGSAKSSFRSPENMSLGIRFENKGNIQEGPFGQVYVKKGNKVLYTYDFNQEDPKQVVLPDSARKWDIPLKNLGKFGKYTVGATFTYGSKNQSINVTKNIWIIPTTYIFGAIAILVFLILLVVGITMFLKSYKRKILESAHRR